MTPANDTEPFARPRVAGGHDLSAILARVIFWLFAALLVVSFLLGGATRGNEISIMVIQLAGVALLVPSLWRCVVEGVPRTAWAPAMIMAAIMVTPLIQLAPLPPSLWGSMPGRVEILETLKIARVTPGWVPLSVSPESTYRSFLWLLPACAAFFATLNLDSRRQLQIVGLVLGLCAASLVLAGLQLTDRNGGAFHIYNTAHSFLPVGLFANRNHQGILMAAGLPFAAAFMAAWGSKSPDRRRPASILYVGLVGLLAVGILVTQSRAALVLAGPALVAGFIIFWMAVRGGSRRREVTLVVGAAVLLLVVAGQVAIGAVLSRFEDVADRETRFDMWPVIARESLAVQPTGTGLGAFEAFYRSIEPREIMKPLFLNHAHNDYLELWLETGVLFPLIFAVFLGWALIATVQAWRRPSSMSGVLARAAGVVVLVLLMHSVVDYPLRIQSLAVLFAFAAGLLAVNDRNAGDSRPDGAKPARRRVRTRTGGGVHGLMAEHRTAQ